MEQLLPLAALKQDYVVEIASNPEMVREAQRLRYEVFHLERGIFKLLSREHWKRTNKTLVPTTSSCGGGQQAK